MVRTGSKVLVLVNDADAEVIVLFEVSIFSRKHDSMPRIAVDTAHIAIKASGWLVVAPCQKIHCAVLTSSPLVCTDSLSPDLTIWALKMEYDVIIGVCRINVFLIGTSDQYPVFVRRNGGETHSLLIRVNSRMI